MWKGAVVAYIIIALHYFPLALISYWAFGNRVGDDILVTLNEPKWLIALANMMVLIHVIGSYQVPLVHIRTMLGINLMVLKTFFIWGVQVYAMPVFDMMELVLVKKLRFPPGLKVRLVARTVYVAFTMFIAITFPFFGGLLGFFGGFAFAPTTYFLPCIMWLAIYKPKRFSFSWCTNWICIILGLMLMILSPIGGLWRIIKQAQKYKIYKSTPD